MSTILANMLPKFYVKDGKIYDTRTNEEVIKDKK